MEKWVKRAILGVIAFNLFQLYLYRQMWNWTEKAGGDVVDRQLPRIPFWDDFPELGSLENTENIRQSSIQKPWPFNSAYRPWTRNPNLEARTCEAFFGNGFIEEAVVLQPISEKSTKKNQLHLRNGGALRNGGLLWNGATDTDSAGSFRCFYSETMLTSICEGTQIVTDVERIKVSRGGEDIEEVIRREEEAELPEFSTGAFQVQVVPGDYSKLQASVPLFEEAAVRKLMPKGQVNRHTLESLLRNLQTVDFRNVNCSKRVTEPTLIITRFEYANLFHTATDWYSAYISSQVVGLPRRPHVLFLDGHCKSPMDDAWKVLFSSVTYVKQLSGSVCFDHAIFAPLGYDTPLFRHIASFLDCAGCSPLDLENLVPENEKVSRTSRLREFGEFFANSFEPMLAKGIKLRPTANVNMEIQEVHVLFVRREDYLAHPRHSGKPESRVSNEPEVYDELMKWSSAISTEKLSINIENGFFAHMTMEQQIKSVKKADVIVGAHGAGLTHLLFADPSTIILELLPPFYRRPHFKTLSSWMGMDYRVIEMDSSSANVADVRRTMNRIFEDMKTRNVSASTSQG